MEGGITVYRQCTSEKTAAQQRTFEEAMLNAMCENSYENISVSDLCRQVGLSRKTFYRLYDSKSDVIYALLDHTILDAETYIPDESVGPGGMHQFFAFWRSKERVLDALKNNRISSLLQQQAIIHVLNESPEIVKCFGADDSSTRREMVMFYLSGLFALVQDWHERGFDRSIDQMSRLAMELFMTPPVKEPLRANPWFTGKK